MQKVCICGKSFDYNEPCIFNICNVCAEEYKEYIIKLHDKRKELGIQPERLSEKTPSGDAIV